MTCSFCGRNNCHACKSQLRFAVIDALNAMERELVKPCVADEIGVTNHMRAAWGARDAINAILDPEPSESVHHEERA